MGQLHFVRDLFSLFGSGVLSPLLCIGHVVRLYLCVGQLIVDLLRGSGNGVAENVSEMLKDRFQGTQTTETKCDSCAGARSTKTAFIALQLNVAAGAASLIDCLQSSFSEEKYVRTHT